MILCTNGANRLSSERDNDVESVNNNEIFGCLFNQSDPKKDDAAKRIERFLSAVPAKRVDDNCFADAALKKLFVQYNTSLPSSAAVKRLFSSAGTANLNSIPELQTLQNVNGWSATAYAQVYDTFAIIFCTSTTANDFLLSQT